MKFFILRNIAKLNTCHHFCIYFIRASFKKFFQFFGKSFSALEAYRLVDFPYDTGNIIWRSIPMI